MIMNDYKIGVWGNFGLMHGLLFCEVCFFVVIKLIMRLDVTFQQEHVCDCGYRKGDK